MNKKLIGLLLSVVLLFTGCTSSQEVGEEALSIICNGYSVDVVEDETYRRIGIKPEITVKKDTVVFTFDVPVPLITDMDQLTQVANAYTTFAKDFSTVGKNELEAQGNKGHVKVILTMSDDPILEYVDGEKQKN